MPKRRQPDGRTLEFVRDGAWDQVQTALSQFHHADIADIIDAAPAEHHLRLFSLVPDILKPDVLAELEDAAESDVLQSLTNVELSEIVEDMAPDDAADVLADLPEARSQRVLALMEDEESEEVRSLLAYHDESAGGIMTTDVVAMREDQTVAEAIHAIAYLDTREQFYYAYIVSEDNRLLGYIDLWELLREKNKARSLGELVHRSFDAATVHMDQEEVARLMSQYDLTALPVVDDTGCLVGRVTSDDVIDVLEDEATEDILRLAGSDDADLESDSAVKSSMLRLPWIFVTLVGGVGIGILMRHFREHLPPLLQWTFACFVPVVLATAGNVGIQSSTLCVRRLALGDMRGRKFLPMLLREAMTGILMGLVCAIIIGIAAHFIVARDPALPSMLVGFVVAIALFSAVTFATVFGAVVPLVLDRFRVDPAIASGPFVTIANDVSALLIYFAVSFLLLRNVLG